MRYQLPNQKSINVFQSRSGNGWNWNLLNGDTVFSGGIGYPTEAAAYAAAMESK